MWRVDPTGMFWRIDASAVGRGALKIEEELLSKAREWRDASKSNAGELNDKDENTTVPYNDLSNDDVKSYLASLTVDEALDVANDCLVNGIMTSIKPATHVQSNERMRKIQQERGLRKRIQTAIIRPSALGLPRIELLQGIKVAGRVD